VAVPVRRYQVASNGELVQMNPQVVTTRISIPHHLQQQQYQPSTIVSVKIVEEQSSTANSTSVRRSGQQHAGGGHRRTGAVSYHQMPDPVQFVSQLEHQSTSVTAAGQRTERVRSTEIPAASSKQTVINKGVTSASDRGSVLQKLNEELQQQISWTVDNSLASLRTHMDILKPSVIKPVPVKAQPAVQRFHPLMSRPQQLPSSTVVPSTAQAASGQAALSVFQSDPNGRMETSPNFTLTKRSPGSSQPNVHNSQSTLSCSSDAQNAYLSVGHHVSTSQLSSPDRSSVGRWYPAASTESFCSPAQQSSSLAADTQRAPVPSQHAPVPSWPPALGSPTHRYSAQQYIGSSLNFGSPMYPSLLPRSPQSLTLPCDMQSANVVSPRHSSPKPQSRIRSPAVSFPPVYSQGSYGTVHHVAQCPLTSVSTVQSSSQGSYGIVHHIAQCPLTSVSTVQSSSQGSYGTVHHVAQCPLTSVSTVQSSQRSYGTVHHVAQRPLTSVSTVQSSSQGSYGTVHHVAQCPLTSVSTVQSSLQVNQQVPPSTFLSPPCCSAVSTNTPSATSCPISLNKKFLEKFR